MQYKFIIFLVLPLIITQLSGCASYEPLELPSDNVPQGPGIFSGDKGYYEIDLD